MNMSNNTKLEVYNKSGKKFIHVKVGTDVIPATPETIEESKEILKEIISATEKEFKWFFTPHTITLEALILDHLR